MDTSAAGGFLPARAVGDERERSRQRSDSLFSRSNDAKGKGGSGEARTRMPASALTLTRPQTSGQTPPPSAFMYKNPNGGPPVPPFSPPSPSITTLRDPGKAKLSLTVADRARMNALAEKKAEVNTRSLSLHLRVRVVEIIGCSEVMWDWVREYQTRELEKERLLKEKLALPPKNIGVGGGRVAGFHSRAQNRAARDRADGGQLALKTSRQPLAPALKTSEELKPLASKTSREPPSLTTKASKEPVSPATKTSGKQPASPAKPVWRAGGGRSSYNRQPAQNRKRANSSGVGDHSSLRTRGSIGEAKSKGAPSVYSVTSSRSGKTDGSRDRIEKGVRQELLHMTRARFDELLLWFQL